MKPLLELFESPACLGLVEALLHSLWLGAIAAAGLAGTLFLTPARCVAVRYRLAVAAMLAIVLGTGFLWQWGQLAGPGKVESAPGQVADAVSLSIPATPLAEGPGGSILASRVPGDGSAAAVVWSDGWLPIGMAIWLAGVGIMLLRAGRLVAGAGRICRDGDPLDDARVMSRIESMAARLGIQQRIRVVVGQHLVTAAVMGVWRPCLLLPASLVTGQPVGHLEAVLAHELAHIRRRDYLVNLGQLVIEALFFFNPFVWWITRQIRIEREACCDALAVNLTRRPADYSQALVDLASPAGPVLSGALVAFGDRTRPSSLRDRVQRLLVPHYRPPFRLHWFGALLSLTMALGAVGVVWLGSMGAARLAAQILTDQERIDRIAEVGQQYGQAETPREYGDADRILISGTIRTEDGSPLPAEPRWPVQGQSQRQNSVAGYSIGVTNGVFAQRLQYGDVYLAAQYPGFAPAFAGPLRAEPGGAAPPVELVLQPGFPALIRLVDGEGRPVARAAVRGGFEFSRNVMSPPVNMTTDADGWFELPHATDQWPFRFGVVADGFEEERDITLALAPGVVRVHRLTQAIPVSGTVVSAISDEPVAGAEVLLILEESGAGSGPSHDVSRAPVLAVTDEAGRFVLNRLRRGSLYHCLVRAAGHRYEWLREVSTESESLRVVLRAPLHVSGRVLGSLDTLPVNSNGEPILRYVMGWRIPSYPRGSHANYSGTRDLPLTPTPNGAAFALADLWEGPLVITAGDQQFEMDLTESIEDWIIDLSQPEPEHPQREVVFRFAPPPGSPPPAGTFLVRPLVHHPYEHFPMPQPLAIENGEARLLVEVPGKVKIEAPGLLGYFPDLGFGEDTIEVPAGAEPWVVTVPLRAAGAIYGEIEPDIPGAQLSIIWETRPPDAPRSPSLSDISNNLDLREGSRFHLTPLPLESVYRLVLNHENTYIVSDPLPLTGAEPVRQVRLFLPSRGERVTGRVLRPDGSPASGVSLEFHYATPFNHGFSRTGAVTDGEGWFQLENLNRQVPGHYSLRLVFNRAYPPLQQSITFDGEPLILRLQEGLTLSGRIIDDATDRPVPGARVRVHAPFLNAEAPTDPDGWFRFSNLEDREYSVLVEGANLTGRGALRVRGGQTEPVMVRVTIPAWSTLRPAGQP